MKTYGLPAAAYDRLERMVDGIEAAPGRLVDPNEFETDLDTRNILPSLAGRMSDDDFIGIVKLAMLTECATDTYARAITERARLFGASWLERFTERVWKPDEYSHAEPFKLILMHMGLAESELEREMREVQEREFVHTGGDSPVHVTTFGMIQEYLTDHYHGLIARLLRESCPAASRMAFTIKRRETLHMVWYRDMTAMQIEAQPELVRDVSDELVRFRLPGNSLIPDLQSQSVRWLELMGADLGRVVQDLVRLVYTTAGSPRRMGSLSVDLAARKGFAVGPVKGAHLRRFMDGMGGAGYGLVGEAVLERAGLSFLFRAHGDRTAAGQKRSHLRDVVRSLLAKQIPLNMVTA